MRLTWMKLPGRAFGLLLALLALLLVPRVDAATVVVDSAEPAVTEQGTVNLDVTITGSGFERRAVAGFYVSGTNQSDPGGVRVNSTTYRNSTKLVANIDVAADATVSKFDVVVALRDGPRGIGIERFAVAKGGGSGCPRLYKLTAISEGGGECDINNLGWVLQSTGLLSARITFVDASGNITGTTTFAVPVATVPFPW